MDHRRFLARPDAHRPFAGGDVLARIGGRAAVDALIDGLYDRIEADGALRPLFGRDLVNEREAQKRFFTEWLGGNAAYSDRAHAPLKHRHELLPITRALAGKWLAHFRAALEAAVHDASARRAVYEKTCVLAMALVNEMSRRRSCGHDRTGRACVTSRRSNPWRSPVAGRRPSSGASLRVPRTSWSRRRTLRLSCSSRCSPGAARLWSSCSTAGSMWTNRRRSFPSSW